MLDLGGVCVDDDDGRAVTYQPRRKPLGLLLMFAAGIVSGLLGIGSGALKVLAMDLVMGLPVKVSSATSNLMIGVTAASTAVVYFARGDIDAFVVVPVAVGVLIGARIGARLLLVLPGALVRVSFVVVVVVIAVQMLARGLSS